MKRFALLGTLFTLAFSVLLVAAETEIDGSWELTASIIEGKEDNDPSKYVVICEQNFQVTMKDGKECDMAEFVVVAGVRPKEIAWTDLDGKNPRRGIYVIDGDTMKLATMADNAKRVTERPKDFEPGEGKVVATYKRVTKK